MGKVLEYFGDEHYVFLTKKRHGRWNYSRKYDMPIHIGDLSPISGSEKVLDVSFKSSRELGDILDSRDA